MPEQTDLTQTIDESAAIEPLSLELPGGTVRYFRKGTGKPTVFLHAAGGAGAWSPFHEGLAAGRDLIAPDHPGFGNTDDFPGLRTIDDLVYHYLDVFDALGLEEFDLIGSSFGGWISAEIAVHSPQLIDRLVLLAPAGLRVPGTEIADLFIMTPPQLFDALFHDKELVAAILSAEPSMDDILKSYREMGTLGRFAWKPYLCNPRLEGRLHRITAPTRVIAAEFDDIIPREHAERYAERIPDAELVVVPAIGHALYQERPDEVTAVVTEFLDR